MKQIQNLLNSLKKGNMKVDIVNALTDKKGQLYSMSVKATMSKGCPFLYIKTKYETRK